MNEQTIEMLTRLIKIQNLEKRRVIGSIVSQRRAEEDDKRKTTEVNEIVNQEDTSKGRQLYNIGDE